MVTLPFVGGIVTDVCDPGTLTVCESVGGTVPVLDDGISVVVVLSTFVPAGLLVETFTDRLEFASSLLRLITTKKITTRRTPIIPSGMNIQLGTPSERRTGATTGVAATTGRADKGRPQFGHATAAAEISCPHSGQ
jgi:hypothetical protein